LKPAACIVFGIDPGTNSGWAIFDKGQFVIAGVAKEAEGREAALDLVFDRSNTTGLPIIVWAEEWLAGFKSHDAAIGTGAGWGRWEHALQLRGLWPDATHRVDPDTWRRAILGTRKGRHKRRELKKMAVASCQARGWRVRRDDAAEASLIGFYGTLDPRTAKTAGLASPDRGPRGD